MFTISTRADYNIRIYIFHDVMMLHEVEMDPKRSFEWRMWNPPKHPAGRAIMNHHTLTLPKQSHNHKILQNMTHTIISKDLQEPSTGTGAPSTTPPPDHYFVLL